ncbi:MAG: penicillin-binding transpeptidase domain-containing protein, partial [Planctomycetota bacterium]|nr:penicillin-binding transpeptidase domain-containing protein [Planctomycetota bacterium]
MRFQRRLRVLYIVFCIALGIVWLRAGQLQIVDGAQWEKIAREMRQHHQPLEARRGSIVSADGKTLAEDTHAFQLAIVPWEWQRRGRARCADCGAMYFERGTRTIYIPRTCSCARHTRRGASGRASTDAYPRTDVPLKGGGRLEKLPDGDVRALEEALELVPGTIAAKATARIKQVETIVGRIEKRARKKGDTSVFLETYLKQQREDLLKRRFLISGHVSDEIARMVLPDEDGRYRGLRMVNTLRRHYPQGDFAPWLLGWTSKMRDGEEVRTLRKRYGEERITLETRWGRRGIERAYNAQLHGIPGEQVKQLDKQGRFTKVLDDTPPRPGHTLHVSVDVDVSRQGEAILADVAKPNDHGEYFPGGQPSAGFVMIDAYTGEILVWAEIPRFDLNEDLGKLYDKDRVLPKKHPEGLRVWQPRTPLQPSLDIETWRSHIIVPVPLTMSRIGQVAVEPGSTMKPLIGLAMLASGRPLPMEGYVCDGGKNPGCHHCGSVDLERAICKSCNRYFAFSLRDSKHWPHYRTVVGSFIDGLGFGHRPTSECADWSRGRWLWNWYDFPMAEAVAAAQERLDTQYAPKLDEDGKPVPTAKPLRAAPRLELTLSRRTPATIAGDMPRLAAKLAALGDWVSKRAGVADVQIAVSQERVVGRDVTLRFVARAAGRTGWFALPGVSLGDPLPGSIHRMAPNRTTGLPTRGVEGDIARGGHAWFEITFPRRIGRTDPSTPP